MDIIRKKTIEGSVQGLVCGSLPDEALAKIAWDLPGIPLKLGSRTTVTQVDLAGSLIVIKQYKSLSLHRRLRYALTRSRARQSWETGQAMADLGLPIVRPLAFFEETRFGIPRRAILLTPFQKGTSLDQYDHPEKIAAKLREIFKTMAENQVTHGDLKANNIIIDDDDGQPYFIDTDASILHSSEKSYRKARAKDEARFLKNWEARPDDMPAFANIFD